MKEMHTTRIKASCPFCEKSNDFSVKVVLIDGGFNAVSFNKTRCFSCQSWFLLLVASNRPFGIVRLLVDQQYFNPKLKNEDEQAKYLSLLVLKAFGQQEVRDTLGITPGVVRLFTDKGKFCPVKIAASAAPVLGTFSANELSKVPSDTELGINRGRK